jgi:membrane-associated phospholipid phosphatase
MLLAYLVVTSGFALVRLPEQPANRWVLLANLLMALLLPVFARARLGPAGRILREFFPLFLLGALYPAIDILNNFGAVPVHDSQVRRWELALFGTELSRTWWQQSHSPLWSLVLHAAYFAFYPIVAAAPITLVAIGQPAAARRAISWIFATFLLCYLAFLIFPVAGPYYEFPRPEAWFLDNPAARLVYATLATGSAYGAAFPSSHVAATLVAIAAAFLGWRRLGWILLLPGLLLTVGVVYCQMHYAVDALAGILVAALVVAGGWWAEKRFRVPPSSAERGTWTADLLTEP